MGHDTRSSVESSLASGEGDDVDEALADGLEDGDALKESDALGVPEALSDAVADGDAEADASAADGVSLGVVGSGTGSMALRELIVTVGVGSTAAAAVDVGADGDADDRGSDVASDVADEDPTGLADADADALTSGSRNAVGSHRSGSTAMVVISPPRKSAWAKLPHGISAATRAKMTLTVAAFPSIRGSARDHRRSPRRKPLPRNATATPSLSATAIGMVGSTFRASGKKFAYRALFPLESRD
jgi:hypothetical protein